jgi:hypothetical protein
MAKAFQCRPSSLLGIDHTVEAFFFDKAVFYLGTTIEDDIEEYTKDRSTKTPDRPEIKQAKRERRMAVWMNSDGEGNRKFRDPAVGR